jgi:hypothetical protein
MPLLKSMQNKLAEKCILSDTYPWISWPARDPLHARELPRPNAALNVGGAQIGFDAAVFVAELVNRLGGGLAATLRRVKIGKSLIRALFFSFWLSGHDPSFLFRLSVEGPSLLILMTTVVH